MTLQNIMSMHLRDCCNIYDQSLILRSYKLNRRSILNYVFLLKRESVSWVSQKQKLVITLIIETEYIIMSICAKTEV